MKEELRKYLELNEKIYQKIYDGDKPDIRDVIEALNQTIKLKEDESN